jgi:hypothetical protein
MREKPLAVSVRANVFTAHPALDEVTENLSFLESSMPPIQIRASLVQAGSKIDHGGFSQ